MNIPEILNCLAQERRQLWAESLDTYRNWTRCQLSLCGEMEQEEIIRRRDAWKKVDIRLKEIEVTCQVLRDLLRKTTASSREPEVPGGPRGEV